MTNYAKHETDEVAEIVRETFSYDPESGDVIRMKAGKTRPDRVGKSACMKSSRVKAWILPRQRISK